MTVWLLLGQGAQKPGMGVSVLGSEQGRRIFQVGSEVLNVDLERLALHAGADEVNDAFNAQALTMAVTLASAQMRYADGQRPQAVVGFSLGQISGLALVGALSTEEAFALLKVRADAMRKACAAYPGAMLALVGPIAARAQEAVDASAQGQVLLVANHNSPDQMVVSGEVAAVERCEHWVRHMGGTGVRLNVAGGFHTPLMHMAAESVREACADVSFRTSDIPLICNTDARPFLMTEASDRLARQVESPVLFEESIRALMAYGESDFVEVGFGRVLSSLVKRIRRNVAADKNRLHHSNGVPSLGRNADCVVHSE